jgi:hypothetical protein
MRGDEQLQSILAEAHRAAQKARRPCTTGDLLVALLTEGGATSARSTSSIGPRGGHVTSIGALDRDAFSA